MGLNIRQYLVHNSCVMVRLCKKNLSYPYYILGQVGQKYYVYVKTKVLCVSMQNNINCNVH